MYYGILVDYPLLLCPLPVSFGSGGGGSAGGGRGWGFTRVWGKRGSFKFKGAVNLINLNILDNPVKTLWNKGANDITESFFKIIKIPTWGWWPLLIQILPVVKVVTAAFHIKNVARNHVNSSFLQRLPTVKLVWWHFLGLNNNDNTNNSVNSKNIYTLLLSTLNPFTLLTKQTTYILSLWGEYLYFKESLDEAFTGSCY